MGNWEIQCAECKMNYEEMRGMADMANVSDPICCEVLSRWCEWMLVRYPEVANRLNAA